MLFKIIENIKKIITFLNELINNIKEFIRIYFADTDVYYDPYTQQYRK